MIVGHNRILRFLERSITDDRIAHAYGFFGPEGVGKSQVARLFARSLLCALSSRLQEECACASCRAFSKGVHPDLKLLIAPRDKELGIDEARETALFLGLTPFAGSRKVVIVEDAHRMTALAANAFLKTVEDPPPNSLLIFISSAPEQIFETLRSRLLSLRFSPLRSEALERIGHEAPAKLLAGRPGFASRWEELSRVLPRVRELLASNFRTRFNLLSRKDLRYECELGELLELASLLFREAAVSKLGERELLFLGGSRTTLPVKEMVQNLRSLFELIRLSQSLNLSPKLTRDVFLFTAPQI